MKVSVSITIWLAVTVVIVTGIGGTVIRKQSETANEVVNLLHANNKVLDESSESIEPKAKQLGLENVIHTREFKDYVRFAAATYTPEDYSEYGCDLARTAWLPSTRAKVRKACAGWRRYIVRDNEFFARNDALKVAVSVCRHQEPQRLEDKYFQVTRLDLAPLSDTIIAAAQDTCLK